MRFANLLLSIVLAGCSGATVVGSSGSDDDNTGSDGDNTGSSAPNGNGSGSSGGSDDPIRVESCVYSDATCLVFDGSLMPTAFDQDCVAFVGVYYGNPEIDLEDLDVDDLDTSAFREEAWFGWAVEDSDLDIGYATSSRSGDWEFPLAYNEFPSGVYRSALRGVQNCDDFDFEDGLVMVTVDDLVDEWSELPRDADGVWCGDDEDGNEDICSVVFGYDEEEDDFDLDWADELPDELDDLDCDCD